MTLTTILSKVKQFTLTNINAILAGVILALVLSVAPVGTAKNKVFETRISLNKNASYPLAINEPKTTIIPGIAKVDMDQLNNNPNPELIKHFMSSIAPEYGVDWRLVYAIGYHESGNYGSALARNNNNYFGRKATSSGYASWSTPEEAIRNQFDYLKTRYFDRGMDTPAKINPVYAEDNSWQYAVESVMNTL